MRLISAFAAIAAALAIATPGRASEQYFAPVLATTVTEFTASGTFTKDPRYGRFLVRCWAGAGGGGAGRRGAAGTARSGGTGGWGSLPVDKQFLATDIPTSVTVTIGTGGAGGIAQASDSTDGAPGIAGGDTTFGTLLKNPGAPGGTGGGAANINGGVTPPGAAYTVAGPYVAPNNTVTTAAITGSAVTGANQPYGGAAGGVGGSISTGNVAFLGSASAYTAWADPAITAPVLPAAGADGGNGQTSALPGFAGYGGAGGAPSTTAAAGKGGNGGRGSGGGGGGASANTFASGAGGPGGDGYCAAWSYPY